MDSEERSENQGVAVDARGQAPDVQTGSAPCARKSAPVRPRRGRPKGSVNKTNKIAKEAITEAAPHAFLIRVMEGRKFMRAADEGAKRKVACYPTLQESTAAARTLLAKTCPDLRAQELTGKDGVPLHPIPQTPRELLNCALRTAHILRRGEDAAAEIAAEEAAETAKATEGSAGESHAPGRTGSGDAAGSSGSPAASSPSARGNGADDSAAKGGWGPRADSDGIGIAPSATVLKSPAPENFSPEKPAPVPPAEGEDAHFGQYIVKCREPMRPGLPLVYRVHSSNGALLAGACNGWQGALKWIKARSGDDADLTWMVRLPLRGDGDISPDIRPDQRESPPPRPTVKNDYGWRKSSR